ncbi:putative glutamate receptor [Amblyomma americanum]
MRAAAQRKSLSRLAPLLVIVASAGYFLRGVNTCWRHQRQLRRMSELPGILPMPYICDIKLVNGTLEVTGVTDILISSVGKQLNCSYSYHLPSVLTYGARGPNGMWSPGVMADLQNNLVDMTFPAVSRDSDGDALADSTSAVLNAPIGILAGRTRNQDTNMAGYLLTFDLQVWAVLLILLVLLSIVMAFLDVKSRRMHGNRAVATESWNEYFWMLFENMLCEASAVTPERAVLRMVSAVWWLAIVVLMNAFSGHMRACLLVTDELQRINTLADVAARPYLKVYTLKGTFVGHTFETSQDPTVKKVWRMIRRDNSDLYGLLIFPEQVLRETLQEKAVVIHGNMLSQTEASKYCSAGANGESLPRN